MAWVKSEEEADKMIEEMLNKNSKSKYITQSVLFKKDSSTQMELLKKSLMSATSFGEFIRQLLAEKFDGVDFDSGNGMNGNSRNKDEISKKNVGNFF